MVLQSEVKDILHLVSEYGKQFLSCSVHLTEQTDQPRCTVFWKCVASCNNGVNVILQNYGKGIGRGGRMSLRQLKFHFDASLFICFSVFLSLFACLFIFFFFRGTTLIWMEYCIKLLHSHCLFVFAFSFLYLFRFFFLFFFFLFVWLLLILLNTVYFRIISEPVERNFKAIAVGQLHCPITMNGCGAKMKWFHAC